MSNIRAAVIRALDRITIDDGTNAMFEFAVDAVCVEIGREIAAIEAERDALRKDRERYQWLANRVLGCDYGDNDAPGQQNGWPTRPCS